MLNFRSYHRNESHSNHISNSVIPIERTRDHEY